MNETFLTKLIPLCVVLDTYCEMHLLAKAANQQFFKLLMGDISRIVKRKKAVGEAGDSQKRFKILQH